MSALKPKKISAVIRLRVVVCNLGIITLVAVFLAVNTVIGVLRLLIQLVKRANKVFISTLLNVPWSKE